MPQKHWPHTWKGHVTIELRGTELTALINRAFQTGLSISDIRWMGEECIRLTLGIADFYRLRPLLKETRTKVRIVEKSGLPFLLMRVQRRKFFVAGLVFFFLWIFAMTSMVWSVEVEGNERIPTKQILSLVQEEGVYVGQLKTRIPSNEHIQFRLTQQLPQVSWVGFRMEGTRAVITVVEKKSIEEKEQKQKDEKGPVNLVARKNGLIYEMQVVRGRPVVEINDVVKRGQLLVSGRYGNPQNPEDGIIVGAKGKVLGEVWYESEVVVPLKQKRKTYTGSREKAYYPYLASRVIRIPFLYPPSYKQFETIQRIHALKVRNLRLPLGWVEEERMEMEWVRRTLSKEEAVKIGMERARADLMTRLGLEGRILEEKVLHPRVDNGKVVMKIHFDVVENIARPQPILQGE